MFSSSLFPILFLLLHNIEVFSITDKIERNLTTEQIEGNSTADQIEENWRRHKEEKRRQHEELEKEIRDLFTKKKAYIPTAFELREDEFLCKCNHFVHCGKQNVADYIGDQFMDVCRPGRGGFCSRVVFFNSDGTVKEVVTSCLTREQLVPRELPFVCQNSKTTQWHKVVNCCKGESFCNDIEFPVELGLTIKEDEHISLPNELGPNDGFSLLMLLLTLVVVLCLCTVGICFGIFCCCFPKKRSAFVDHWFGWLLVRCRSPTMDSSKVDCQMDSEGEYAENSDSESECSSSTRDVRRLEEATFSTGSGSGVPMLEARTIARQIILKEPVGKGRFGEVFLGEWRGEKVAVKIFSSRDGASFMRETDIYRKSTLRHPNLLRWIISDRKDSGEKLEHWLVTEYCPNGSLLDHLEKHTLTIQQCLQFIRSIAHGLDYLHTELPGIRQFYKPSIAHRDLKPGNILIKNDRTCCIADLGMCIRLKHRGTIDKPDGGDRGGTARYLAPEFLAQTYNSDSFISYLQMDIYALALVIWEICSRVEVEGLVQASADYQIPYFEFVNREPTLDEMKQIVCVEGRRPTISEQWSKSTVLKELSRVIRESWNAIPQSRLTALNIRFTMDGICAEEGIFIIT